MGRLPPFGRSIFLSSVLAALLEGCGAGTAPTPLSAAAIVLKAAADSATEIDMSWAGSRMPGARYQIYRDGTLVNTVGDTTGKTHDTGLAPGSQHCYRVSAVDTTGAGIADSNESCATTAPLAAWHVKRIAPAPPVSLALDAEGRGRVAFCSPTGVYLRARQADGSISTTSVDPSAACSTALLAVGGDDSDHVVYADTNSDQLKYATDVSGRWVVSVIPGADGAEFPSIDIDQGDAIHMAYLVFTGQSPDSYQLDYASNVSGSWQTTTVENVLAYPSIAVDAAGTPHIAYLGTLQPDGSYPVHYRSYGSSGWSDQVAATSADPKTLVALAVAPGGQAGLIYKSQAELEYATDASGGWMTTQVDSFDATGPEDGQYGAYDVSMDLDSAGNPHLAYQDTNGNLKYASLGIDGWDTVYVDTEGTQNQIRMDAAGHAHITYAGTDNLYSKLAVSP